MLSNTNGGTKLLKAKRDIKGFTLIELIIALSIISILSLAFFKILNSSIKYNTKNEKDIKALNIAQSEVENLRREIKLSNLQIILYDRDKKPFITIPENNIDEENIMNNSQIVWCDIDGSNNGQIMQVSENHKYIGKNSDGSNNVNALEYERILEKDNTPYIVNLNLSRYKKGSKFLYDIEVKVRLKNQNLSKKETILNTSILSK